VTAVPLSLSPSVVLLVGDTGERVHRQLSSILELVGSLGPPAGSIELLHVRAADGRVEARPLPLGGGMDEAGDQERHPLAPAFELAARRVNSWLTRLNDREGHSIAHDLQVLIAGGVDEQCLGEVLEVTREGLAHLQLAGTICYLLDGCLPSAPAAGPRDPVPRQLADLSFLFTDRIVHPGPAFVLGDDLRQHVLTQSLFGLLATGIPMAPGFAQLVRDRPADGAVKLGSFRTCLVAFPRESLARHCAARLSLDLVAFWRRTLLAGVDPAEVARARPRIERAVHELWEQLDDRVLRPASDPDRRRPAGGLRHLWPRLRVGADDAAARGRRQLQTASEQLFGLFAHAAVDRAAREQGAGGWADVAGGRTASARGLCREWRRWAQAAWTPLAPLLVERVRSAVGEQWAGGERRLALLRSSVEECDERLSNMSVALAGLRERHHRRYRREVAVHQELATPWLGEPDANPAACGDGGWEELGDRLSGREERIATALGERVRAHHALVLRAPALLTAWLLAFAAVGMPAFALASQWLRDVGAAMAIAGVAAVSLLAGVTVHMVVRGWRRRAEREAESDLLRFLCLCYAHRCERVEDRLRVMALGPARWWVQRIVRALADVDEHLDATAGRLEAIRAEAEWALFDTPSGTLDVLVAEGLQLVRAGSNPADSELTPDDVLRAARRRLGVDGQLEELTDAFLATLSEATDLVTMDEEELADRLIAFAEGRLGEAIAGHVAADVHRAVCDPAIQRRAAQLLDSPLYGQRGTMQPIERYVCGRPPTADLTGLPAGTLVLARQSDWWLLAAVFAGGTAPNLDEALVDRLFPRRSTGRAAVGA
jgi:hypothetical protein